CITSAPASTSSGTTTARSAANAAITVAPTSVSGRFQTSALGRRATSRSPRVVRRNKYVSPPAYSTVSTVALTAFSTPSSAVDGDTGRTFSGRTDTTTRPS